MINLQRLQTSLIADEVKDHLSDLKEQGLLSDGMFRKSVSFNRIIRAINQADMDVCRIVKQEVQMILLVPAGLEEVFLENTPGLIQPTNDADFIAKIEAETNDAKAQANQIILNREWFIDASNIRSQFLHAYSQFPVGNTTPAYKIKLVRQDMFDDSQMKVNYNSAAWGDLSVALFEVATKRIRFGSSFSKDTFISFPAYLIPSVIDITEIHPEQWGQYKIKAPKYAQSFLIYKALERILPIASPAQQAVKPLVGAELQNLYTHIPTNTAAIEVTDGYIG